MQIRGITFPQSVVEHLASLKPRDSKRGRPLIETMEGRAYDAMEGISKAIIKWHPNFPDCCKRMVDIGCGMAIIDAMLVKVFKPTDVFLIDGNGKGTRIGEKYSADQQPWDDVQLGVDMVRANLLHDDKTTVWGVNVARQLALDAKSVDFIISLKSWGHHYPVDLYLEFAQYTLSPQGLIILDIREGTDGMTKMKKAGFRYLDRIPDQSIKCKRLVYGRQQ